VLRTSLKCSELATLTQRDDGLKKKPRRSGAKSLGPEVEATGPLTRRDASRGRIARAALSWFVARRDFDFAIGASEKEKLASHIESRPTLILRPPAGRRQPSRPLPLRRAVARIVRLQALTRCSGATNARANPLRATAQHGARGGGVMLRSKPAGGIMNKRIRLAPIYRGSFTACETRPGCSSFSTVSRSRGALRTKKLGRLSPRTGRSRTPSRGKSKCDTAEISRWSRPFDDSGLGAPVPRPNGLPLTLIMPRRCASCRRTRRPDPARSPPVVRVAGRTAVEAAGDLASSAFSGVIRRQFRHRCRAGHRRPSTSVPTEASGWRSTVRRSIARLVPPRGRRRPGAHRMVGEVTGRLTTNPRRNSLLPQSASPSQNAGANIWRVAALHGLCRVSVMSGVHGRFRSVTRNRETDERRIALIQEAVSAAVAGARAEAARLRPPSPTSLAAHSLARSR
jgi:hypothetical protein